MLALKRSHFGDVISRNDDSFLVEVAVSSLN
jgi:hypothetical protein